MNTITTQWTETPSRLRMPVSDVCVPASAYPTIGGFQPAVHAHKGIEGVVLGFADDAAGIPAWRPPR